MAIEHINAPSTPIERSVRAANLLQRQFRLPDDLLHFMAGRERFEQYFNDLSGVLEGVSLDYAFAPASGSFLGPLLLVDTLVMYDQTPLINSDNPLEEALLTHGKSQFLPEINEVVSYLLQVPQALRDYARDVVDVGFEVSGKQPGADNLASIIAGVLFLGVAVDDITIRPYTHARVSPAYELTFPINGVIKKVYYHAEALADVRDMSERQAEEEKRAFANSFFFRHPDLRQEQGLLFLQANIEGLSDTLGDIPFAAVVVDVRRSIPASFIQSYKYVPFPPNPEIYSPLRGRGYRELGENDLTMWVGVREPTPWQFPQSYLQ